MRLGKTMSQSRPSLTHCPLLQRRTCGMQCYPGLAGRGVEVDVAGAEADRVLPARSSFHRQPRHGRTAIASHKHHSERIRRRLTSFSHVARAARACDPATLAHVARAVRACEPAALVLHCRVMCFASWCCVWDLRGNQTTSKHGFMNVDSHPQSRNNRRDHQHAASSVLGHFL